MAAAAAVAGCLTDVRKMELSEIPPAKDTIFAELIASIEKNPPNKLTVSQFLPKEGAGAGSVTSDPSKSFTHVQSATMAKINIQVLVFLCCKTDQ